MVTFLDEKTENKFRRFVNVELAEKYQQVIEVTEGKIVSGLTGTDIVEEALKISFYPEDSKVQWVENKIAGDIHRYCYENKLIFLNRSPVIERDLWLNKIRYTLIYTWGE